MMVSCGTRDEQSASGPSLFVNLASEQTGITFTNTVKDTEAFNIFTYRNFYNGGGVAIGDINNDSLPDIYFTSNQEKNRLFLNKGNWTFEDITDKAGVGGTKSWSTGVTMADVNADGLLDIYVCNSGDVQGGNKENELFINNGDLTFSEKAVDYGLNDKGYSTHASFFDYDQDGDLDCYILNNSFKSIDRVEQFLISRDQRDVEGGHKLMQNDNGHFIDVSAEAGIYGSWIGFGLGVSVSDLNGDMFPDIYISNDFWERDYLYINQGNGKFSEEIISRTNIISASSMGSDVADLDNDGDAEIFTTDMLPADNVRIKSMTKFDETNIKELKIRSSYHYQVLQNCLQFNDGNGNFQEMANVSTVAATDWSWGALMFDMDNNGWKDIFVSNGIYRDITSLDFADFVADRENIKKIVEEKGKFDFNDLLDQIPSGKISNYAFVNNGDKTFQNLADSLGLGEPSFSNGSAYGDLDNDGDYDLVINNVNDPCFVYRNDADKLANNYLKIILNGNTKNPFGIGAQVTIYSKGQQQVLQNYTTRGFESSVAPQLLFGLGKETVIDSAVIVWPDLKMQALLNVKANSVLHVDHANADRVFRKKAISNSFLFTEKTSQLLIGDHAHRENNFNDFDYERLLPRKISAEGPKIVRGDVNGDKLEDFILLGAFNDEDKLFVQQLNGKFQRQLQKVFAVDSIFESTCGIFTDLDNDKDLDLIIGSGGNEFKRNPKSYELRYYLNDSKGNFQKVTNPYPVVLGNFSCILSEDFDNDGDVDLFIGGRIVPGNYGLIPKSFLFRNEGSKWTDITPASLAGAGMITGAVWSDFDDDAKKDLIVVGEWMPVKVFRNSGTTLGEANSIKGTEGWWSTIEKADLNADGTEDYVLGNWGLNSKFKATEQKPLSIYVKDFDQNGKSEFVINWYPPGEQSAYPFASKLDLTSQMPSLKKKSLKYSDYASKTYEELFSPEQRDGALTYKAISLQSAILWNRKGSESELQALPLEAQVSPVMAIDINDFDSDGNVDILLCGNFYGLKPEVGRQDSNRGILLKGNGKGEFDFVPQAQSGIFIQGEVRDLEFFNRPGGPGILLISRNNMSALALQQTKK